MHRSPDRGTKRRCPECGGEFHSDIGLVLHLQKEHGYGRADAWEIVHGERAKS